MPRIDRLIARPFRSALVPLTLAAGVALTTAPIAAQDVVAPVRVSIDTSFFGGLSWDNVGPVRGGRSIAVSGSASRPYEYYFGATGGGLWKTTDGGTTWQPVTDDQLTSSSVGAVAQCEANPDIVYIGMGESEFRGDIMQGDGLYRSTDAGRTWTHTGLEESQVISKIRVHPWNCNLVYAAVLGHAFGSNPERGVYRSKDGGRTWEQVLYRDEKTGAIDLIIDPVQPATLYAGFWEIYRQPWGMYSGGPGSGLFKSMDGGDTWTELTRNEGLPSGLWGKVGIAVSPADHERVWALIENENGGLFRSDDAGATWERVNEERRLRQRAFYYSRIYADPANRDIVYALNTGFYRSRDGGRTFSETLRPPHGDNHDLWIAPNDPERMINGNDGGANVSVNGGRTWTDQDYPTAQLYHVIATHHDPYWVCGAQQDNSTACVPSSGWPQMAPLVAVGGGESGYIANDPDDPNIFYAGSYGGDLTRYDYRTGMSQVIDPWPDNPMGHSSEDIAERFQWTFPIVFSQTGPKELYVGSQHLWMTTNGGMSWDRLSPDLTRADPKTMGPSGGPITKDQTGVETYATIFTIAPSPHDANTIWVGTDDGYVQITRDHGTTWQNVTPPDMPEFARIGMIDVSPHRPGAAYVAARNYQLDDRRPYIFRTEDYGRTWVRANNGIPARDYVHAVREDPVRPGLLFAGTEHGVWLSFDNGTSWTRFSRNLPDVQVADIVVKDNDLVIATHGRSAYVMRDIGQLRQVTAIVANAGVHLFDPADPQLGRDNAVHVAYYLRQPATTARLEFIDPSGTVVRTFEATRDTAQRGGRGAGAASPGMPEMGRRSGSGGGRLSLEPGTHDLSWDLRYPGATTFPGLIMWAAGTNGPRATPGEYQVRLTVDDQPPEVQTFRIGISPLLGDVTAADLDAQFDLALKVRDRTSEANQAVIDIRDIKAQIEDREAKDETVKQPGDALRDKLTVIEGELYQYRNQSSQDPLNFPIRLNNRIAALMGAVEGVNGRPTAQSYEVYDLLSAELETQLDHLAALIDTDLTDFNRLLQQKGLVPIRIPETRKNTTTD